MNGWFLALTFVLLTLFVMQAPSGWRALLLLVIPVGFLQEPIRKLMTGQPVRIQLMVVLLFGLALLAAAARHGLPTLTPLAGKNKQTRKLLVLFILIVGFQSLHSIIRYGTPMVPIIGLISYLLPMPALWLAYVYSNRLSDQRRFLTLYFLAAATTTFSVILNYSGINDPVFEQLGASPMVVYHELVGVVELYCGFLRSPEVAAWHAAAATCAAITVAFSFKGAFIRALAPVVAIGSVYTILLTGRRKALAILAVYVIIYIAGLMMSRRTSARVTAVVGVVLAVSLVAGTLIMTPESSTPSPHLERGITTFGDVRERFQKLGIESIAWAYHAGGLFGLGTGAGAQGTQHVEGVRLQGSAEGGLGRIMLELGAPGLVVAILCAIAVAKTVRQNLVLASRHSSELFKLSLGMTAFIGSNVPVFVGAAQIFGDPFVLLILGVNLGFVLAVPRIILSSRKQSVYESSGLNLPKGYSGKQPREYFERLQQDMRKSVRAGRISVNYSKDISESAQRVVTTAEER